MQFKSSQENLSKSSSDSSVESRRGFMKGLIAGGVLGTIPLPQSSLGQSTPAHYTEPPVLTGKTFDLTIDKKPVNFTGVSRMATAINGSVPGPTLRWKEGDVITINVTNRLSEPTSLHWHGIILPYTMDGVPGLSYGGIQPGETFQYRFKVEQSGTYWYHSHSGFQEMTGMYGAIIIDPIEEDEIEADRDHVILLSEWTDENPHHVFQKLKTMGHLYNFSQPTMPALLDDIASYGLQAALSKRSMFNAMRMKPTDLADLSGETLSYLMNGVPPDANGTRVFSPGERVRLRIVNGAGNTFFDFRIPGLAMTIVQVDGVNVHPVTVDEFRIGPGETYDAVVKPTERAYTLFAETMERSGYALGTLAVDRGLASTIPARREVEWLSMTDMMGDMSSSEHDMEGMTASGHGGSNQPPVRAIHATTEYGPSTDMRVDTPRTNLDDPGVGLRNASHRVLVLSDLKALHGEYDRREVDREIELHLTGNMERYSWSIDGLEYGKSTPVHFKHGEKIRVHLHNDTMMTHPMHLHGMWSDLEDGEGNFLTRRHTIPVQPAQRISFTVTADALGRWAWHCHLLLHMDAGMFREVVVA